MKSYLVGGAVRDGLLNLPVKDRDWVVVGADEGKMLALGFRRLDGQFPVYLHPETAEEYALARREIKTGVGYKGFLVETGPDVTLEQDLIRRDFTINAMAQDETGHIIDPYGGQEDLRLGMLRHVSPAFIEDPVRLLRAARFTARLSSHGFSLAHSTFGLMKQMASDEELASLQPARIWLEIKQVLLSDQPWRFFEVLQRCGALKTLIPELSAVLATGTADHGAGEDCAAIAALKRAVAEASAPEVCFAVLLYFVEPQSSVLKLPVERDYQELLNSVCSLSNIYPAVTRQEPKTTLELMAKGRALQRPDYFANLCQAFYSIWPDSSKQTASWLVRAKQAVEKVQASQLKAEGFEGPALGQALEQRRLQVLVDL